MCHRLAHMHAPAAWIHNDDACHPHLHERTVAHHALDASMYAIACITGGKRHRLDPLRGSQGAMGGGIHRCQCGPPCATMAQGGPHWHHQSPSDANGSWPCTYTCKHTYLYLPTRMHAYTHLYRILYIYIIMYMYIAYIHTYMYYSQASIRLSATHGHAYAEEHTYLHPPIYIYIHTNIQLYRRHTPRCKQVLEKMPLKTVPPGIARIIIIIIIITIIIIIIITALMTLS